MCAFNFEKIITDLMSATDKTVECNVFVDFLGLLSIDGSFDYKGASREILSHSSEPRDFVLKAFECDYYYNDSNYGDFPEGASFAAVVKHIAQICSSINIQKKIYQGVDATNVIRAMQLSLVADFENEIRKYNRTDLHKRLQSRLAAFVFSKTKHGLTYSLSREDIADDMKVASKEISANSREDCKLKIKTLSYAVETNLFLERDTSLIASDEQLNYIIAFADWLVVLQDNSDSNRWGLTSDKIEIEFDYRVMTVNDEATHKKSKSGQERYYENRDYIPTDTPSAQECKEIYSALDKDLNISFEHVLLAMHYLKHEFLYAFQTCEVEKDVFAISKDRLIEDTLEAMKEKTNDTRAMISNAIDFLTVNSTKIKSTVKKDGSEEQHDLLPIWERENRWHRIDIKPLACIGGEIYFSPIMIHETRETWLHGLAALYPPVEANLKNTRTKLDAISARCQKQMESDVASLFNSDACEVVVSFEFKKRQKTKQHDDVGDYDVLFIDTVSNTIWNIECKFIHKVANIFEAANQQKGFFKQNKYQDKFQRRIDYLASHLQDLFEVLNIKGNANDYKIINYMVTNKVFEAVNRDLRFEIITFHELRQIIKAQ